MDDLQRDYARKLAEEFHKWGEEIHKLTLSFESTTEAVKALNRYLDTPVMRRMNRERILGYHLPDWVWNVEEKMRRTEGSGNGRIMRD